MRPLSRTRRMSRTARTARRNGKPNAAGNSGRCERVAERHLESRWMGGDAEPDIAAAGTVRLSRVSDCQQRGQSLNSELSAGEQYLHATRRQTGDSAGQMAD